MSNYGVRGSDVPSRVPSSLALELEVEVMSMIIEAAILAQKQATETQSPTKTIQGVLSGLESTIVQVKEVEEIIAITTCEV